MSVIAWRFIIAGLLMIVLLYSKERPTWHMVRQNFWMYLLIGIIGIFGMNGLLFVGLNHTSAVNASLIMDTNPIVTVILFEIFLRERIRETKDRHARLSTGRDFCADRWFFG